MGGCVLLRGVRLLCMPTRRTLPQSDPASALWGVPHIPGAMTIAVVGLLTAVVLAVAAAVLPIARVPLIVLAVLVAVPSAAIALRRARSMPGGHRDLMAITERPDLNQSDPLTGAGTGEAIDAALAAAVLDPEATPLALVRLVLASADPDHAPAATATPLRPANSVTSPDEPPTAAERELHRPLVLAAIRWLEILRPGDLLARLDGAEFAVLLPRCDARAVGAVVSRLTSAVPDGMVVAVGVAQWDGQESPSSFQVRADRALDAERSALTRHALSDPGRVAAVAATGLARRRSHAEFDEIAAGVAWLLRTPIVVITLFDETWQHFIGEAGVTEAGGPREGTPARDAICRQTVTTGRPLVVSDTRRHPELQDVPAARDLGVLACASVPITSAEGHVLGSVCSMVLERHTWTGDDVALLKLTAKRIAERLADASVEALTAA